ncbi:hypothetical protein [Metamycoplasma buccale]|uniref:hypothetical protein n=1 Tax=Metamycoplasma buccale TaxID=55602 RepID=UPI00398EE308
MNKFLKISATLLTVLTPITVVASKCNGKNNNPTPKPNKPALEEKEKAIVDNFLANKGNVWGKLNIKKEIKDKFESYVKRGFLQVDYFKEKNGQVKVKTKDSPKEYSVIGNPTIDDLKNTFYQIINNEIDKQHSFIIKNKETALKDKKIIVDYVLTLKNKDGSFKVLHKFTNVEVPFDISE